MDDCKEPTQNWRRGEERDEECDDLRWWLLTEAKQYDAWDYDAVPKRELTEVSIEREQNCVSTNGLVRNGDVVGTRIDLANMSEIETVIAEGGHSRTREILIRQIALGHRQLS